ncbi:MULTISPECIES: hypothetical protein [Phyllobacteriaceae]|jgi:hypothetical protein|uniref:Uncharacterized protein n=1 Tax=Mesorhizobium hungaricum TaxID=1566387 RepID=A0A1C2DFJ7_9HYPH|nr:MULTISPECIES: hypothetical protein [Mesorhizobium]MBN9232317.1 hypothetical protein [Mesorhizobium sp.]MDQ0329913.1 hypothetical protein [Mesorhizobium sp. YL-MeA3-2017]OCX13520.1 hypothetical protein QV13_29045 [Mesorhizobium hungaricum]
MTTIVVKGLFERTPLHHPDACCQNFGIQSTRGGVVTPAERQHATTVRSRRFAVSNFARALLVAPPELGCAKVR